MKALIYLASFLLSLTVRGSPVANELHALSGGDGRTLHGHGLRKRALDTPGIGVELEVRNFKMSNNQPNAQNTRDDKEIAMVKGTQLCPAKKVENHDEFFMLCQDYWDLTAEHGGGEPDTGISRLTWEYIINGRALKLTKSDDPGTNLVLATVWNQILTQMDILNPRAGDQFFLNNVDPVKWGAWTLDGPAAYNPAIIFPGIQVTAPLPMEAIQDLISILRVEEDLQGDEKLTHVFKPLSSAKIQNLVLITREDLSDVYESHEDITSDTLGFYSLLMSYVRIGITMTTADRDLGPKQKLSIMPRTDWQTMYDMYGKDKDQNRKPGCKRPRPKKKDKGQTLVEVVKELAKKKNLGDVDSGKFLWKKENPPSPPAPRAPCANSQNSLLARSELSKRAGVDTSVSWFSKQSDIDNKELSVKTWLEELDLSRVDTLSIMDKLVWDGQIGGLGDRIEAPLYPEAVAEGMGYPLFEIRDLTGGSMKMVENFLNSAETQIKVWHKNPPEYGNDGRKRGVGNACERPKSDNDCNDKQVKDAQGKCEDCPAEMKPNPARTQCIKDKCMGSTAPNAQKQCEACPKGTKPNVGNTSCAQEDSSDDKRRGKCKDEGYILDPAQGGQNDATDNPICTLDDSKKCDEPGWTAITRSPRNKVEPKDAKAYTPECAKDEDPNYRCKNSKTTYHHMKASPKGDNDKVIAHSCRSTAQSKKEQKDKYQKRVEVAKEQKARTTQSRKVEKKDNNRRHRNGFCFALLVGITAWDLKEVEAMSPDEVDGLVELWPENDADPEFLDDHMVTVGFPSTSAVVGGIETETAAILPSVYLIKAIIKLFKIFSKPARAAPPSTRKAFYSEIKEAGSRPKAPQKSIDAAKSSGTVGKIMKDPRFLSCLAAAPALAASGMHRSKRDDTPATIEVGQYRVGFNWTAERNSYKIPGREFEDRQIVVKLGVDTDDAAGNGGTKDWASTYPDRVNRPGRLVYEDCQAIPDDLKNKITAVETWGGCCTFYADSDCKESSMMFSMTDREDWQLDGKHNDNMEAVWCTFEAKCKGAPGAKA